MQMRAVAKTIPDDFPALKDKQFADARPTALRISTNGRFQSIHRRAKYSGQADRSFRKRDFNIEIHPRITAGHPGGLLISGALAASRPAG